MSVIIVGGGMAGATLALALSTLSQGKLPVTLIEGSSPDTAAHPGFDSRAIALAAGTCQQLERIGVWSALKSLATPITDIHVSDRGHLGQVTLNRDDYNLTALGNVIELHAAGKVLFQRLQHAPGVTLHCPAKVASMTRYADNIAVTLENGSSLNAQTLIIANGNRSPIARQAGFEWQRENYEQVAIIANVSTTQPHNGRAFERFTTQGPIALLPMSGNRLSLVWCVSAHRSASLLSAEKSEFLQQLQQTFGWRLGKFTDVGQREAYPLSLQQAHSVTTHRCVVIGNAAQSLHPIAGQGFNLGMRDVMSLAETLTQAFLQQQDLGSFPVLNRYQQRRVDDRATTIGITDGLVRLFANDNIPLTVGRNLGLFTMQRFTGFKHHLASRTLGWVKR
ncbi:2-octaprenyl-6-methoxyphenyl hydroxylase [Rosenbergiella australiborealis]|uniref:2-octaprenyl-6-methoxyphenyl hydroxylase n=1 Tax=Rosenbergiella australiborealis TaxID=1544696 RepID=A0ABS5T670_9GAMM|nr:2-octaprenyl-6-methoxyphenyl hydroxylase [Rosenbergiella australiborealis]MBT0727859.1 2-octaprenyl-6-methoxyphenyl hydroxylase [Rosenbergiella australiborealis]